MCSSASVSPKRSGGAATVPRSNSASFWMNASRKMRPCNAVRKRLLYSKIRIAYTVPSPSSVLTLTLFQAKGNLLHMVCKTFRPFSSLRSPSP